MPSVSGRELQVSQSSQHVGQLLLMQDGAVQRADGLDVQTSSLFQHSLHLHTVLAHDADEIAAGFGQPLFLHVQCAELAESISAEQDFVCIVIGHDDFRPVDHGGGDEVQGVMAQGQSVAFLDDDAAVSIVGAEELLHHDKRPWRKIQF